MTSGPGIVGARARRLQRARRCGLRGVLRRLRAVQRAALRPACAAHRRGRANETARRRPPPKLLRAPGAHHKPQRIAYVAADQRYSVWRDGFPVFAGETALAATNDSVFGAGGFFLGDYAFDISGDWEVDYIGLHDEAVAPAGVIESLAVVGSGFVTPSIFFIDFKGRPNASYNVMSSTDLNGFETMEALNFEADGTTDENGLGRAEINVVGRVPGKLFFRLEASQ